MSPKLLFLFVAACATATLGTASAATLLLEAEAEPTHAAAASRQTVTVLDFKAEGTVAAADWTVGLSDFVELALQQQGVPTLERRQIRLLLGERDLAAAGTLAAGTLQAAKLPALDYFVSGVVSRTGPDEFALTLSVVHADNAAVKASWTRRGLYSRDWLSAIEALAAKVRAELQTRDAPASARAESEALTWLPEAALPFFKGLAFYSRGDYALAVPWFRNAAAKAGHFDEARLWETRATRQAGFPFLANVALQPLKPSALAATNPVAGLPVAAVIAAEGVPAAGRAAFVETLKQSGQFRLFDPGSIQATARETDLQLTGQMAAPLNERSVWLVVDSVILLEQTDGSVRARERELLSGEPRRRAGISAPAANSEAAYAALAQAFLASAPKPNPPAENAAPARPLSEPEAQDTPESVFAKTLRLARAHPDTARYWVALSDFYGEWEAKKWLLEQAIQAVEHDRQQPEAAFWLASALWRQRHMTRWAWLYSHPEAYRELPLTNDFARLLQWFPHSPEATAALEEDSRRSGIYVYSDPKDRRFVRSVFETPGPARWVAEAPARPAPTASDTQRLARLKELRRQGAIAKAWRVADALVGANDPSIQAQARPLYDELFKRLVEEEQQIKACNAAFEQGQGEGAWKLAQPLLHCLQRKARLTLIERCSQWRLATADTEAYFQFVFDQAELYQADFNLDPVTGAPVTVILDFVPVMAPDYTLPGHPLRAQRWTTSTVDLEYARLMGDLADQMLTRDRPDLCARIFEALRRNPGLPRANRLTAAFDLASTQYRLGKAFEALETLRELLQETEGTDTPMARKTISTNGQVAEAAFGLLRKIRLYCDAQTDFTRCCGEPMPVPKPQPEVMQRMNALFNELWKQVTGGVGANNRPVRQVLLQQKEQALPVLLYRLWRGDEEASHLLLFCGELGTNAAAVVPYLPKYVCFSDSFPECNNALSAFCSIGKPAACATPLLILAAEGTTSTFNAEAALRRVGPAPKQVMPYLAKLLYHPNPGVRKRAAKALLQSAALPAATLQGKSDADLVAFARKWWETEGASLGHAGSADWQSAVSPIVNRQDLDALRLPNWSRASFAEYSAVSMQKETTDKHG